MYPPEIPAISGHMHTLSMAPLWFPQGRKQWGNSGERDSEDLTRCNNLRLWISIDFEGICELHHLGKLLLFYFITSFLTSDAALAFKLKLSCANSDQEYKQCKPLLYFVVSVIITDTQFSQKKNAGGLGLFGLQSTGDWRVCWSCKNLGRILSTHFRKNLGMDLGSCHGSFPGALARFWNKISRETSKAYQAS